MTAKRIYTLFSLALLLSVGATIRLYRLGDVPSGFFCDEAAFGVNAISILQRGQDEFGAPYPLFFRSFGDYKEPIPTYSVVPLVYLFGLSEWSVRLMSVIYGILNLVLIYAIGSTLKNPRLGLLSVFVGALMPWLFHYDRVAFHCGPYLTTLLAAIFLLISAKDHHPVRVTGFFIFLGLSLYTYSPAKLMAPMLILFGVGVYWRYLTRHWIYALLGITLFGVIATPLAQSISSGEAIARATQLNLFNQGNLSWETLAYWLARYEVQFLPSMLFAQGEPTMIQRHLTNFFPPLLLATAPFLILGVAQIIRGLSRADHLFLLLAIASFPLGATLTGAPYTHRSILGAPLAALSIGLGLEMFITAAARRRSSLWAVGVVVSFLMIGINAAHYFQRYLVSYPLTSSGFWGWQYGPREVIRYFLQYSAQYDQLIMQGELNSPQVFFKFYDSDNLCTGKCLVGDLSMFDPNKRQLFALNPAQIMAAQAWYDFTVHYIIKYPNGETAFMLSTVKLR
jgi:4-amino-4-deoxy-L-arabinose transferase-like glycosyltransferase